MRNRVCATVDKNGKLDLIANRHRVPWLKGKRSVPCVIDVQRRGLVLITPLEAWAASVGMSEEEAPDQLTASAADLDDEEHLRLFLCDLRLKGRADAHGEPGDYLIRQLQLPDMALYALFDQGQGPMVVRKGRGVGDSGKVLIVIRSDHLELWGQSLL